MFNCKQVTELISRSLDEKLTLRQYLSTRLHMMKCSICRNYEKQVLFMRAATRKLISELENTGTDSNLSKSAQMRIRETLNPHSIDEIDPGPKQ